jgi:hypothetical protein
VTQRRPGSARIAVVALSILMGTAACGTDEPGADRSNPVTVLETSAPDTVASGIASSTSEAMAPGSTLAVTTTAVTSASVEPAPETTTSGPTAATVESDLGLSEADVAELEQQLDEIDRVLADMEAQLAQD